MKQPPQPLNPKSEIRNPKPLDLRMSDVHFTVPIIKIRQPDGSVLVRAGALKEMPDEVGTGEFAKAIGVSIKTAWRMIDEGVVTARKVSPKPNGRYRIPVTEIERIREKQKDF